MASEVVALDPESELALVQWARDCAEDPLRFVLDGYPWGEPGPLKDHDGPDMWQAQFLKDLGDEVQAHAFDGQHPVAPIRRAVSSGHGIGKSVVVAWLVDWLMSTRPHCQGTVTANTFTQLETKTWASIQRWTKLCITAPWFVCVSNRMYHRDYKESWFCAPQSCREENSEAFAGQHAADSTSFYINDEDSAVPDKIHEVEEGGLTDGEPMQFLFGNPTRSQGAFHAAAFGAFRNRFKVYVIDSRDSKFTNKEQIAEWQQDYGEDSDFFRVRVRGLPPNAAELQFIDLGRVLMAQKRVVAELPDTPLVAGCDLAWGGSDDNVIRFRRGMDAQSIPPIRIKGEFTRDPAVLTAKLAHVLTSQYDGRQVSMLFLDSAGIAGPIAQRLREQGHRNIQEVNFGADSPDPKFRYMRDFMWGQMKQWLLTAAIDKDQQLEVDLTGPGTRPNDRQLVWLESKEQMKKRGVDSPDDGDALALTFASPVKADRRVMAMPRYLDAPY